MSKDNYYDRKRDAEERVKAVVDFVKNDDECRSVQLLRYFNEKTKQTCGRCDVCQKHFSQHQVVEYETVQDELKSILSENMMNVQEVLQQCSYRDEEMVLESIRFLVDSGELQLLKDGTLKKK